MAALPTPDPRPDGSGYSLADKLRLIRELGASAIPVFGALELRPDGSSRLVVVERASMRGFEEAEIGAWIGDARQLAQLDHPNVVRVREVIHRGGEVRVVSDFVDGVRWTELASEATGARSERASAAPLEAALRVFVDALAGLSALHNLRDAKRQPLKLVHGGLTPDCLLVGSDGITRVLGASRLRSASARLPGSGSAYLAPEVLLEDDTADARADVYSIGVMLWEALSGRPFLPHLQPSAIVTQLLSGRLPAVTTPSAIPWASPLAEVVTRALSANPEKRFASASTMAAELRRIAGARLPAATHVASLVQVAFGEAIRARRQGLESGEARSNVPSLSLAVPRQVPDEGIDIDLDEEEAAEASSTAPTLPPPGPEPEPRTVPVPLPSAVPSAARDNEVAAAITPIAIATPLVADDHADSMPPPRPPRSWHPAVAVIVGSVTVALAATCWLVARTHGPSPPSPQPAAPTAVVQSQPLPAAEPAAPESPFLQPAVSASSSAAPPATHEAPVMNVPAPARAPLGPSSSAPAVPWRPRPTPTPRRVYDPQGI